MVGGKLSAINVRQDSFKQMEAFVEAAKFEQGRASKAKSAPSSAHLLLAECFLNLLTLANSLMENNKLSPDDAMTVAMGIAGSKKVLTQKVI